VSLQLPIALDAMGGEKAPASVVNGAKLAYKANPDLRFRFYGDEAKIAPLIHKTKSLRDVSEIVHTEVAVGMHEKPSVALRQLRNSSMRLAIDAVSRREACAVVSGGNTGALMLTSKFVFKTLKGIERPAITAFMPAQKRDVAMLDMGANVDCSPEHLVQFAIMGDAYARVVLGVDRPKVALLNVGAEDMKGHELVQTAHQLLKAAELPLDYAGFVEGNDILEGTVDVVVTDGFTGNIALKTAEGAARMIYNSIRTALESSFSARLGYLLAKPALSMALRKFDPRAHNGAILLGLNGIAVKSHGGTDAKGFSNAIKLAVKLVSQDINRKIIDELEQSENTANPVTPMVTMPSIAPESLM